MVGGHAQGILHFVPSLHIITASTSGHTDYVVGELVASLKEKAPQVTVTRQRAELAQAEDFTEGDMLLLGSGTWNTGGPEGQLNPHMHLLLRERAKDIDLKGKRVAVVGLGDARYRYTARALELLEEFVKTHGGQLLLPSLRIINEPYGQEKTVQHWAALLLKSISLADTRHKT